MTSSLYWNTVNELLRESLFLLLSNAQFDEFRLVGGTSLSLQIGHRLSVDIDLFSDLPYGAIDFEQIDKFLNQNFPYVSPPSHVPIGFGKSYLIGQDPFRSIKLDIYHTEPFLEKSIQKEGLRLASVAEIAAMKMDVIQRGGRKKDFWDIHELLGRYSLKQLLELHKKKYPYIHDNEHMIKNFNEFLRADDEPDPICLRGKYWELIKLDLVDARKDLLNSIN